MIEQLQADNEVLRASLAQARAERDAVKNVAAQYEEAVNQVHQICFAAGVSCGHVVGRVREMAYLLEQARTARDGYWAALEERG